MSGGGGDHLSARKGGGGNRELTQEDRGPYVRTARTPENDDFKINLTFEGHNQRHRVTQHMFVEQLTVEAADVFQIKAADVILMLLG